MTTVVKINAHCSSDKEVVYEVATNSGRVSGGTLQDGETFEAFAYDDRRITVYEREKPNSNENTSPQGA